MSLSTLSKNQQILFAGAAATAVAAGLAYYMYANSGDSQPKEFPVQHK
jgi:flagellar biosynthesis/type III secretory pathway M-ring protein FliF/YscJ